MARNDGNADQALAGPRAFERQYEAPFLAHACMEPMNCTADVRADGCDVYVPTQGQTRVAQAAIAASGLPADKVKIHTTYMGGGFGRRGEADFVIDAVETSKAVGKPVKVVWSREDDIQHDYYRPVSYARMWGALDASGAPTVFKQRLVQQSLMKRIGGLPPNGVDFISLDGAANLPYAIPERAHRVQGDRSRASRSGSGARWARRSRASWWKRSSTSWRRRPGRTRISSGAICSARRRATRPRWNWRPRRPAGARRFPRGAAAASP